MQQILLCCLDLEQKMQNYFNRQKRTEENDTDEDD